MLTHPRTEALHRALDALPARFAGPGGAAAVLRHGTPLAARAWGWADAERRIPFTPGTLFRICSISKQFTCGVLLDRHPDPSALDGDVRAVLPRLDGAAPRTAQLAHNQSGLRDYWAAAMLCGAPVEGRFGPDEAQALIGRTRTLHFVPGTRYSYCNQNFRILGDIAAARAGLPLDALMRRHMFDPAGMTAARLVPDTKSMPDGTVGYEGTVEGGFRPAVNRIHWTGDAGVAASLDDMVAWEAHIDATRDDRDSLYRRLSAPVSFADGAPAAYGYGLARMTLLGREATGHGGGLRGWRSFRCHMPSERLSAVVLFNHMADPRAAALDLLAAVLDHPGAPDLPPADPALCGTYEDPETGLLARVELSPEGKMRLFYSGQAPELLDPRPDGSAASATVRLRRDGEALWMDRATDNLSTRLEPRDGPAGPAPTGRFHCAELDATLTCADAGGAAYAAFSGFLGDGAMGVLVPAGPDLWRLPFPRALDHAPPGDWTLALRRDGAGQVRSIRVGCWLARGIEFTRLA